ncbi:odorant receptor 2a-like isoform X2 [Harpegnathos saltator]|uniref:odorant receptor 2a-like isoform X2 n=1 Tax=Harpegnathos saltator TaxID=610380 RepID=UPI000DBEE2EC|nr:odorant receptor 2a-like isoform X2 [Harpegnathos saltator]
MTRIKKHDTARSVLYAPGGQSVCVIARNCSNFFPTAKSIFPPCVCLRFPFPSKTICRGHAQFFFTAITLVNVRQSLSRHRDDNMAKITTIPWSNVNCEKDIVDALVWSKWILRILGIWPLVFPVTSRVEKILATTSFALSWSALGFLLIPIAIFTLSDHTVTNDKVKMLGPLGHVLISMLKYLFLVVRHKSIRQCIRGLSFDWRAVQRENYRTIMMKDSMKSHMLSKFCIAFMYCGGLSYVTVMPFLSQKPDGEKNATVGPVPYLGFDIIFDLRFVPGYVFVFCMQCFSAVVMFNITTAVYCLAAMFVAHACGQIEIVMARVESFMKDVQSNRINSEHCMAVIVKHHVKALRFSASIENILSEICLVEVVGSTLIICLLEYYFLMEWQNSDSIAILAYSFLLTSFVFNIFIFCYISELLTDQYSKVGYTFYKIDWYLLPGKIALDFTLMISMSHHPIKITAGKLISLSFTSFGAVLKTSVAYLNLLRTVV